MASTFSESWYQVAPLKLALLPTVRVHKQIYRGEEWYVLQDACSEKYYRLRPIAYQFASELNTKRSVEEIWLSFVERFPEEAPGQEDVIQLLSQLHHSNLLFYRSDADHELIFERFEKQRTREHLSKLMAPLYLRIPIWNPNEFLNRFTRVLLPLFGVSAFVIWLLVILLGGKSAVENFDQLWVQGQGILALDNLIWLYVSMFVLKIFHELGHAIVCKKYGGNVHTMGIMFIVFTPLPYMDASASWAMRNRWHRAMVGAAGMYVELFFAAVAALIWAHTAPGTLNSLAFNIMVIGSVSSILFNGNPLLRFDAYYILSDIIDIPNLYQKANQQWLFYFDKWLLGTPKAESPALSFSEGIWLTAYGILSYIYRFLIMLVIMIYVLDIWIGLALIMAVIMLFIWLLIPLKKLFQYLLTSSKLQTNRSRAWLMSMGALALLFGSFLFLPMPYSLKAPGVIQSVNHTLVYAQSGGRLMEIRVRDGEFVQAGQVLVRFEDEELIQDQAIAQAQLEETRWMLRSALQASAGYILPLQQRETALSNRIDELAFRLSQLEVRAPHDGIWVSNQLNERRQSFFSRGEWVGEVINPSDLRFVAVVTQEMASNLFQTELEQAQIRIRGNTAHTWETARIQFIPFQKQELPSMALGWDGGGRIMTTRNEAGHVVAVEPFFEIHAMMAMQQTGSMDGKTGVLKLSLPWKPLYWQIKQTAMQLLQKRFEF
ncbi:PqqD family peptide modification chaperone [Thiomicrospira microaerophila]|uniref:PqqD family peptide modification chaperone n=1 Tax=Thiomicrospira microaerophila TaxID=406020 RepID=UPI0005C887E3|nr:PqqD family peptide modification chaperone [Thiomicrospira microaerophila]